MPLNSRILSRIADGIFEAGSHIGTGGVFQAIQNIYGDIVTESDQEDIYGDFSDAVMAGLRGR